MDGTMCLGSYCCFPLRMPSTKVLTDGPELLLQRTRRFPSVVQLFPPTCPGPFAEFVRAALWWARFLIEPHGPLGEARGRGTPNYASGRGMRRAAGVEAITSRFPRARA